jgi:thymidine phosphorylase
MSAWLMAVCWQGMTLTETGLLTKFMVQLGTQLHWNIILVVTERQSVELTSTSRVGLETKLL